MIAALVSALHVLALALGLPSVYFRGRALRGRLDADGLRQLFLADNIWGLAAALWLVTGLLRAFGGLRRERRFTSPRRCSGPRWASSPSSCSSRSGS